MAINGDNGKMEEELWETAEKLRGPVEAAEYKHVVLGLLFLKYMSDAFERRRQELDELTRDPDSSYYCGEDDDERQYILTDRDEYYSENVLYVPEEARWQKLQNNATSPQIGVNIDEAMRAVEEENPEQLKGMMHKRYSGIPQDTLEGLLNQLAEVDLGEEDEDTFGRVYEYFIKEFARQEGHRGGEFYTPKHVVELLVEILEPYEGRIFDPFCGSGGMFVQSKKFIEEHGGNEDEISVYGQEVNNATLRICKMNLFIRGIEGEVKLGDSIRDNQHKGLKADRVITNPPFNMSEWGKDTIADDDPRFKYGMPPSNNANFAFMQHMLHHTKDDGLVGTVMANGSMSIQGVEGNIRQEIIEDDLLDAVISLPEELFYTTSISVCIWILSKNKSKDEYRDREGETLFIDAQDMYEVIDKTQNKLTGGHIQTIADTVRAYRGEEGIDEYEDKTGYCKVVTKEEIQDNQYIVTPGRYVGIEEDSDDGVPFEVQMDELSTELREQFRRSEELQSEIEDTLREVGF
jgi:type I restriction enzyme M protein